ncbi:MAG TPA: sulfotransferase, partial [Acetobacteraceae bacterium]|nr:sulfotransferase [Acetobacteraceae bacterium]
MLDAHPDVSCQGEGLFLNRLAVPLDGVIADWRHALDEKNNAIFGHTGGYPLPGPEDAEILTGTAILLALHRQSAGKGAAAIGEKTPENVFFFPRLRRIFPGAKFIAIARDPRDVLTSAWHFFHKPAPGEDEAAAKLSFVRNALPSLTDGVREMLGFARAHPAETAIITYEGLQRDQSAILARLFRHLGVSDRGGIVADCIARTEFATLTGGRKPGVEERGSFFRKGVVGDWRSTLTPEIGDLVLREAGWMFPQVG